MIYGQGISREGELIDLAVKFEIVQKSGSWFSYKEERLCQGRDKLKDYLRAPREERAPVEIPLEAAAKYTSSGAKSKIDIVVDE